MKRGLKNICLLFHCIADDSEPVRGPHPELFIKKNDLRKMIEELLSRGYAFSLPWKMRLDKPNCVVTFDDGYFNNTKFLDLSKEYGIPFILFLNSYNIIEGKPFIWDIWEENLKSVFPYARIKTKELYAKYGHEKYYDSINSDSRRPFTLTELRDFAGQDNIHLGLHTHTHQPLVSRFAEEWEAEIQQNKQFFTDHGLDFVNELSLPTGIYTRDAITWTRDRFQRIYTINGGTFSSGAQIIDRISLISCKMGGSLIEQIDRSIAPDVLSRIRKLRSRLRKMKYAYLGSKDERE